MLPKNFKPAYNAASLFNSTGWPMAWAEAFEGSGAWVCEYGVGGFGPANAFAVRLGGEDLAVVSPPVRMPEEVFIDLEKRGRVVALVAPHSGHDLGLASWQSRYPDALSYAPLAALSKLARPGLRAFSDLSEIPSTPGVEFREVPGAKRGGTIVMVRRGGRPVVYLDELVGNQAALPGLFFLKLLFWITASSPGIKINHVYATLLCDDKRAVAKAALDALKDDPVIVPAHGAPLVDANDIARARKLLESTAL